MKTRIDGLARREKSELLQQRASACEAAGDLAGAFKALESARAVEAENTTLQVGGWCGVPYGRDVWRVGAG